MRESTRSRIFCIIVFILVCLFVAFMTLLCNMDEHIGLDELTIYRTFEK